VRRGGGERDGRKGREKEGEGGRKEGGGKGKETRREQRGSEGVK